MTDKVTKEAIANWIEANKDKIAQKMPPGISFPQATEQPQAQAANYPEYDVIVVHDRTHEFIHQVHIDPQSNTLTIYLPEGVEYKGYDKSRVAAYLQQGSLVLNVRGTVQTAIVLTDAVTCHYYTTDKVTARDYPTEVSPVYEFDRPAMFGSCANPAMKTGAQQVVVPCTAEQGQMYCDVYEPSEALLEVSFKATDCIFQVTRQRMHLGVPEYRVIKQVPGEQDVIGGRFSAFEHGDKALEAALDYLNSWSTELGITELSEVPTPEKPEEKKDSYFDKVLEYAN